MLQVSLLGGRTVVDDATGEVLSRSSRTTALIAYLAAHAGTPQPRGRIAATFWPSTPEQQALTNLRRELHQLRRVLGDDGSLVVTASDLSWHDTGTCTVDLRVFARARTRALAAARVGDDSGVLEHGGAALETFHGELLPGLYDDWTTAQRDQVTADAVELCTLVADAATRAGRWTVALGAARRRVLLAPFEEAGHRDLIRINALRGDRAAAISAYHHCESVLDQELGLRPSAETRQLLADLVDRPPRPAPGAAAGPASASVGFVGRRTELEALTATLDEALAGATRTALVVGEPGVGKTRLVAELAREARRRGAAAATAQCYGAPGRLALAPVADWLGEPGLAAGVRTMDPTWRSEVHRLLPSAQDGRVDATRGVVDAWQRHRFFQGLARALCASDRPLLLVLDNLQWCDEETLDFLTFFHASEPTAPVMFALTGRASDLDGHDGHSEWVRRMRATGVLHEIALAPFDLEETGRLLRLLSGQDLPDEAVRTAGSATGGFPLYVVEAARRGLGPTLGAGPPADLEAVLRARFDQLDRPTLEVAGLAAATGRDFDLELLCEASDLEPDAVVNAVDELWRLRILREVSRGYDFSHDLLRAAAYRLVSPPSRWLLHRRLAQALEILHVGRIDDVSAQLADQYARAGNTARALDHYHRAAEVAARVFAHAEAIRLHEAALGLIDELPPGGDREQLEIRTLTALAASLTAHRGYADPQLATTLERSVAAAEHLALREPLVDALVGLWASRFVRGQTPAAHQLAERAVELAHHGGASTGALEGEAHFAFAGSALSLGRPGEARDHFELAFTLSADEQSLIIGSHPAIHARAWSAHAAWLLGDDEAAASSATDAIARARAVDHPYSLAIALAYAAVTWQLLGDLDRLVATTDELDVICTRHEFAYYADWGLVLGGWARDDPAGNALMDRGVANLRASGAFARMPYWLSLVADRCADPGRARAVLDAAAVSARARQDHWWLPEVLRLRAARFLDGDEAADAVRAALSLAEAHGSAALVERCRRQLDSMRTPAERSPS